MIEILLALLLYPRLDTTKDYKSLQFEPPVSSYETIDPCSLKDITCDNREESQEGNFSAYNATIEQCGKADGITASGQMVKEGTTLACPPKYKFGTEIEIEGLGVYECQDRGGAIKGNKFDIYFDKVADAKKFGRQKLNFKIKQCIEQ